MTAQGPDPAPAGQSVVPDLQDVGAFRSSVGKSLIQELSSDTLNALQAPQLGDHVLNPGAPLTLNDVGRIRLAAVLVPVVERPEGLAVLLTQRTEKLPSHAGQISFPGGKVEGGDESPSVTAMREAEEELGLDRAFVEPIGFLDPYQTVTGFKIAPLVATLRSGFAIDPDLSEVAEVFEVPLSFLMDAANHHRHSILYEGRRRYYYAMPYEDRYIWGATAGILRNMYERFFA